MITTTSHTIEGHKIIEYKQIVFGEVVTGINFIKDFAAGLTNIFGGRSGSYEGELIKARQEALKEMENRAIELGANAIISVDFDYQVLGSTNNMMLVTVCGTAIVID